MSALLWYFALLLTGWAAFPLAYRLLPALADRGYALSRALGLLLAGYVFWLLASLHLALNTPGGAWSAWLVMMVLSAVTAWRQREALRAWLRERRAVILWVEGVFLLAFAAAVAVRSVIPAAVGTEKPMEMAFLNAILRSPTFPPHDPWLSGYAISYYYFGYVLVGMLAQALGVPGTVAFNLGLSTVFALTVTGAFGLAYTLIRPRRPWVALLAPLFVALTGNWEAALEVLHSRGLLSPAFWQWLGIRDLATPPQAPFSWAPHRFWWWWRASRVVSDFNLAGTFQEVIDEFPFFSYLLGDLHPHVLALPFALLAVGLALNGYLGGARPVARAWRALPRPARPPRPRLGERSLAYGRRWVRGALAWAPFWGKRLTREVARLVSWPTFALAAVVLGGLAFLNTWDFPIYVALFLAALAARRSRSQGWVAQWKPLLTLGLALGVSGWLLYLPFYVGFSSQAGGVLPNLTTPTRGVQFWVMFGVLLVPVGVWLVWAAWPRDRAARNRLTTALGQSALLVGGMFVAALLLGWMLFHLGGLHPGWKAKAMRLLGATQAASWGALAAAAFRRHLAAGSTWFLLFLLGLAWYVLQRGLRAPRRSGQRSPAAREGAFAALLVLFGGLLVLTPNFFYLLDQFGTRMNTVFKFYYQGWVLWGLAAAYAAAWISRQRSRWQPLAQAAWAVALLLGLLYPVLALPARTDGFHPAQGLTLDAGAYLSRQQPDLWGAVQHLQAWPVGPLAEAVGGSYSEYARVSTYSGQPAVLGWPGHESQWRGGDALFRDRTGDVQALYTTPDWSQAQAIIAKYHIRYIVVAPLERHTYAVQERKFQTHLPVLYQQGEVVVYGVPAPWR